MRLCLLLSPGVSLHLFASIGGCVSLSRPLSSFVSVHLSHWLLRLCLPFLSPCVSLDLSPSIGGCVRAYSFACVLAAGIGSHPFVSLIVFYLSHNCLWPFGALELLQLISPRVYLLLHALVSLLRITWMAYVGAFLFGAMLASAKSAKNFTTLRRRLYGRIARVDSRMDSRMATQRSQHPLVWRTRRRCFFQRQTCRLQVTCQSSNSLFFAFCIFLQSTAEQDAHRIKAERALNKCGDYGRWPTSSPSGHHHILHENDDPDDKRSTNVAKVVADENDSKVPRCRVLFLTKLHDRPQWGLQHCSVKLELTTSKNVNAACNEI